MSHEESDRTYRLRPYFRNIGIACTLLFLCAWVGSVLAAYFNTDGSFARPKLAIIFFSIAWGSLTLIGVWLVLAYVKYRLLLSDNTICHVGVLQTKSIMLETIQILKWRLFPQGGSCVLTAIGTTIKIEFNSFTKAEQTDLIAFLRRHVTDDRQNDWDAFHDRYLLHSPQRARQQQSAKRILILVILAFAVAFAVLWLSGQGIQYLVMSALNLMVGAWATFRDLRAEKPP